MYIYIEFKSTEIDYVISQFISFILQISWEIITAT